MNERNIFVAALRQTDAESREAFLIEACGDDAALRQNVEALLREHNDLGSFLEAPAADLAMTAAANDVPAERPGTVIGRYKLMEQIGEGGMGLVYIAEQHHPVRRKVALKLIKPGMDSRQVIARFEAERQALALMDHPNIARVIDGGTTGVASDEWRVESEKPVEHSSLSTRHSSLSTISGRPYFVMELVRGVPITEYCDENRLTTRARLDLFLQVCAAVQHAHQKGIIHRDIKPSNVMVVSHDGTPVVKVIDFGIAKAIGQQLTDKTIYTHFVQFVGTPAYMSPEQAGQSGLDIDTRTDVYALGVLLYELLTGTTPFDKDRLKDASYDEIRRIIRDEEPPRPSTRVSTLNQLAGSTISAQRRIEPKQLSVQLRGEVDWIVMKALEKDRTRRYQSASALATDVERYLNDEPVEACPPSRSYLVGKFLRRHRVSVAIACLAVAFILLLGAGLGWLVVDRANQRAERERAVQLALDEADRWERDHRWREAAAAAHRAVIFLSGTDDDQDRTLRVKDRDNFYTLLARLEEVRAEIANREDNEVDVFDISARGASRYREAFLAAGFDVSSLDPAEFVKCIPQGKIRYELAGALDDWACLRRRASKKADPQGGPTWERVLSLASAVDPQNNELRSLWSKNNAEIKKAVNTLELGNLHPYSFRLIADTGLDSALLRSLQQRHPHDFWLNYELGKNLSLTAVPGHFNAPARMEEAARYLQAALAARPNNPDVMAQLGYALAFLTRHKRDLELGLELQRNAIEKMPSRKMLRDRLGLCLINHGMFDLAVINYQEAISKVDRTFSYSHQGLFHSLALANRWEEAEKAADDWLEITTFRNAKDYPGAVRLVIDRDAEFKFHWHFAAKLAFVQLQQGRFAQSNQLFRQALDKSSEAKEETRRQAIQWQMKRNESFIEMQERLPAILAGKETAAVAELLEMANYCCRFQKQDAARLYELAFALEPSLEKRSDNRYRAACTAAWAGCGLGADAANRDHLRQLAARWLEAEWHDLEHALANGSANTKAAAIDKLAQWQSESDLAGVRDEQNAARFGESEAAQWRKFWSRLPQVEEQRFDGELDRMQTPQSHRVRLSKGQTYVIDLESRAFDTILFVKDRSGKVLAQNDNIEDDPQVNRSPADDDEYILRSLFTDGYPLLRTAFPNNRNSRIVFAPAEDAEYELVAMSAERAASGCYRVRISKTTNGTISISP